MLDSPAMFAMISSCQGERERERENDRMRNQQNLYIHSQTLSSLTLVVSLEWTKKLFR